MHIKNIISENFKKYILEAFGLFLVVISSFYIESVGIEYQTRQSYIEQVKVIRDGLGDMIEYCDEYSEGIDFFGTKIVSQSMIDDWYLDNDSIFLEFYEDDDGGFFYAPLSQFTQVMPFDPPKIGFEIFQAGNQDFKLEDPFATKIIEDMMTGIDLAYLRMNTNEEDLRIVRRFEDLIYQKWALELEDIEIEYNYFWIKNRRYLQRDNQLRLLVKDRMNLWEGFIDLQLNNYKTKVEDDKKVLDSLIQNYDNEKYFLYWRIK